METNYTDQELVKNYLNGDEEAFGVLIKRYLKPLYNFVIRFVGSGAAEDVVQEASLKLWRNLKKYNPEKSFKTWFFQIAKNTAYDYLRKKNRSATVDLFKWDEDDSPLEQIPSNDPPLLAKLESADSAQMVNNAIQSLSPVQQTVLNLYYREQLTFKEIAIVLGEPLNTVKSRQRRALIELKKILS